MNQLIQNDIIKIETSLDSKQEIKLRLRNLFLNYCEIAVEKADVFITQTALIQMFRDAKIINQSLTAIEVNISIQKTL